MKVKEITSAIEKFAPLHLQESYDNAGMQVGDADSVITGVVLCTDVSNAIVDEAIACGANLIISHHPLIFHGLKKAHRPLRCGAHGDKSHSPWHQHL